MLERMWDKGNTPALLVKVQIDTTPLFCFVFFQRPLLVLLSLNETIEIHGSKAINVQNTFSYNTKQNVFFNSLHHSMLEYQQYSNLMHYVSESVFF